MRQLLLFTVFLLYSLLSFAAVPNNDVSSINNKGRIELLILQPSDSRPNSMVQDFIECIYTNTYIEVSLPQETDELSVVLSSISGAYSVPIMYGVITSDSPRLNISVPQGSYIIQCTTTDGSIYEGTLVFK